MVEPTKEGLPLVSASPATLLVQAVVADVSPDNSTVYEVMTPDPSICGFMVTGMVVLSKVVVTPYPMSSTHEPSPKEAPSLVANFT